MGFIIYLKMEATKAANEKAQEQVAIEKEKIKNYRLQKMNEHRRKRDQLRNDAQAALDFLRREVLIPGLLIDSNIWMNKKYEDFFAVLDWLGRQGYGSKDSRRLKIHRVQFDEICLKKDSTEYKSDGNIAARIAINRIESLQTKKLLSVDAGDKSKREEADPALLKLMTSMAENGKTIRFITDDVELRIRTREFLGKHPAKPQWKLIEIEDVMARCNTILEACKVGSNPSSRKAISS